MGGSLTTTSVAGREGEALRRTPGGRRLRSVRKDDDLQFTDTCNQVDCAPAIRSGRALVADGEGADAFVAPHDAHLVAVFVDGLGADDGPS